MQKSEKALCTIADLKKNHPGYYDSLAEKCKVCQHILSSVCDMCENCDMFVSVKEEKI